MTCLLAVTTDLPDASAFRIHTPAGSSPPMSSTTMSTSDESTSLMSSVHLIAVESQSTRLRCTLRLRMCVRRSPAGGCSVRIRATELPTVPKPTMATLRVRCEALRLPRVVDWGARSVTVFTILIALLFLLTEYPLQLFFPPVSLSDLQDGSPALLRRTHSLVFAHALHHSVSRLPFCFSRPEKILMQVAHCLGHIAFAYHKTDINF